MSSESFASTNLIGAVISQSNRDIQTRLHGLVDKMTTTLKSELDAVLKNLLDISDEYDETSRIILTLPCVKRAISTGPYTTTIFPDALANLRAYDDDEGDELADAVAELEEPVCEKERIEIVITEIVEPVLDEESDEDDVDEDDEEVVEDVEEDVEDVEEDVVEDVEEDVEDVEEDVEDVEEDSVVDVEDALDEDDEDDEEADEDAVEEDAVEEDEDLEEAVVEEDVEDAVEDVEDAVDEDAVDAEVVDDAVEDVEDEEGGVFEVEINGETYYTDNEQSGEIYNTDDNGDPNEIVGKFVEGIPVWN